MPVVILPWWFNARFHSRIYCLLNVFHGHLLLFCTAILHGILFLVIHNNLQVVLAIVELTCSRCYYFRITDRNTSFFSLYKTLRFIKMNRSVLINRTVKLRNARLFSLLPFRRFFFLSGTLFPLVPHLLPKKYIQQLGNRYRQMRDRLAHHAH